MQESYTVYREFATDSPPKSKAALNFKILGLLLAAFICIGLAPGLAHAASDTSWYTSDTDSESYAISSASQLQGLADLVNDGTEDFSGKTVTLESSVALSGQWTPIGTSSNPFNGTFDGGGNSISGMSITSGITDLGLFGCAGSSSLITNVNIGGTISVSSSSGIIEYVGGVVGNSLGSISNITGSVNITVYSTLATTEDDTLIAKYIGGVAGSVYGSISDCTTTSSASVNVESPSEPYDSDHGAIVGYIGGIVGRQGPDSTDLEALPSEGDITGCTNNASVRVQTYAIGSADRFGEDTYASSTMVGGIAGYACGNISGCVNTANIDTGYYVSNEVQAGFGASFIGGIVGGYRVYEGDDSTDPGMAYNTSTEGGTAPITISDCYNTGDITGLVRVAGICGNSGSYTTITRCYNTGWIGGTRWNKPSPAGILAIGYSDISYCYNLGEIVTTTGGGYYASGICGILNSPGKDYDGNTITPEIYACYNTGYCTSSNGDYRATGLVGDNEGGYVHDCWTLQGRSYGDDVTGANAPSGTFASTAKVINSRYALYSDSIAALNACCDKDGWECYYTLPEGASYKALISTSGTSRSTYVGPVLVTSSYSYATDLSEQTDATVTTTANAHYSASMDPVPTVSVTLSDGTTLVQNADYRVVPEANTAGVDVSDTEYTATIEGIGIYKGILSTTTTYTIEAGNISDCSLTVISKTFNWEKQTPDTVILYDSAGNEVDSSQYSWSIDQTEYQKTRNNVGNTKPVPYQDANNNNDPYPVIVTAVGGNYVGEETFNAFTIKSVSMVSIYSSSNTSGLVYGDVTVGDESWDFTSVASVSGDTDDTIDKAGTMKVKYTGSPILPEISSITYLGQQLTESSSDWYGSYYIYDYAVLYGNPNPDTNDVTSDTDSMINVTGDDYACVTIRGVPFSNFSNYVNILFEITPASISDDVSFSGLASSVDYDAANVSGMYQNNASLTYNGMTLVQGTDYTESYNTNTVDKTMTVTYTGMGNYDGTYSFTYRVYGMPDEIDDEIEEEIESGSSSSGSSQGEAVENDESDDNTAEEEVQEPEDSTLPEDEGTVETPEVETPDDENDSPAVETNLFNDMLERNDWNDWYWDPVYDLAAQGIITGYLDGSGNFGVDDPMTRGDFATILWRYMCPDDYASYNGDYTDAANTTSFVDVPDSTYETPAICWAAENGVVTGYEDGTGRFGPDDPISFEQMVAMVSRLASDYDTAQNWDTSTLYDTSRFTDGTDVSEWASSPMAYAIDNALVNGNDNNDGTYTITPLEDVARQRVVTVLWRAINADLL